MPSIRRQLLTHPAGQCSLALLALVVGLEPLVVKLLGSSAPGWSHWWCSASPTPSTAHVAGGSGRLGTILHTSLQALAVHWPHFLPILLALGTLAYLWHADAQHRARAAAPRADTA